MMSDVHWTVSLLFKRDGAACENRNIVGFKDGWAEYIRGLQIPPKF
jgi:hypothetical protein